MANQNRHCGKRRGRCFGTSVACSGILSGDSLGDGATSGAGVAVLSRVEDRGVFASGGNISGSN